MYELVANGYQELSQRFRNKTRAIRTAQYLASLRDRDGAPFTEVSVFDETSYVRIYHCDNDC